MDECKSVVAVFIPWPYVGHEGRGGALPPRAELHGRIAGVIHLLHRALVLVLKKLERGMQRMSVTGVA